MNHRALNLSKGGKIFVNESPYPYWKSIWNLWKRLEGEEKIHQWDNSGQGWGKGLLIVVTDMNG